MPRAESSLTSELRRALARAADRARAPEMQAYMKSTMPFLGVAAPARRKIVREALAKHPIRDAAELRALVLELWRGARHREPRYVAVDLVIHPRHEQFLDLDALPMIEELIVDGAWWDTVDGLASHAIGSLLRRYPTKMKPLMRRWSKDENLWKRRTAILSQLRFKHDTDTALLYQLMAPSLSSDEFFLQKAIGWALRQLAWSDPDEVRRYVAKHEDELSPLSKREALKNIRAPRRTQRPRAQARAHG